MNHIGFRISVIEKQQFKDGKTESLAAHAAVKVLGESFPFITCL